MIILVISLERRTKIHQQMNFSKGEKKIDIVNISLRRFVLLFLQILFAYFFLVFLFILSFCFCWLPSDSIDGIQRCYYFVKNCICVCMCVFLLFLLSFIMYYSNILVPIYLILQNQCS